MNKSRPIYLSMVLWACEIATSYAAVYVLIPGISGETTEANHVGWVELQTLQWGHAEGPPGSPARVQFTKVNATKLLDSVSPALALLAANGQQIKDVKAEIVRTSAGTSTAMFRLKLTNVRLANYAASVQPNQSGAETIGFEFDTISWISFKPNQSGGPPLPGTSGCWDIPANKACPPSF
jgi:type VI secretion system secreted protein Hcp